jgi:hypothetical protein
MQNLVVFFNNLTSTLNNQIHLFEHFKVESQFNFENAIKIDLQKNC